VLSFFFVPEYTLQVLFDCYFDPLIESTRFNVLFWTVERIQKGQGKCFINLGEKFLDALLDLLIDFLSRSQHKYHFDF
jgi:hypothetical protein